MKFKKNKFNDLIIIEPTIFKDSRGLFYESFRIDLLNKKLENKFNFCQENIVKSGKMVLRGLHYQVNPLTQAKLVSVISGSIIDIAVDLRKNSSTYAEYFKIFLSEENKKQIFIPGGFAHGYVSLEKNTIVNYKVDNYYNPEFEDGIIYNDKNLSIDWGVDESKLILSEKDKNLPNFKFQNL